jgi:hypothetical protein
VATHTSLKTKEFVANNSMVIVPHPPYLLDIVPCDLTLFPKLQMKWKGHVLKQCLNIQKESQVALDSIDENDFHGVFEAWKKMMA